MILISAQRVAAMANPAMSPAASLAAPHSMASVAPSGFSPHWASSPQTPVVTSVAVSSSRTLLDVGLSTVQFAVPGWAGSIVEVTSLPSF